MPEAEAKAATSSNGRGSNDGGGGEEGNRGREKKQSVETCDGTELERERC